MIEFMRIIPLARKLKNQIHESEKFTFNCLKMNLKEQKCIKQIPHNIGNKKI